MSVACERSSATLPARPRPLRVLVADDNRVVRLTLCRLLTLLGCDADSVGNGTEAVEESQRRRYDVLLLDLQMPGMDGYEAALAVSRSVPPSDAPRMIAMTACDDGDRPRDHRDFGLAEVLPKPVRMAVLVNALGLGAPAGAVPPLR